MNELPSTLREVTMSIPSNHRRMRRQQTWFFWLIITVLAGFTIGHELGTQRVTAAPHQWQIVTCDVGQGSASLIHIDHDSAVLVDAGDEPDKLLGCLNWAGISKLEGIFLTHEHEDHVKALESVKKFRGTPVYVSTVFEQKQLPSGYTNLQRQLQGQSLGFTGDQCSVEAKTLSPDGLTAHLEASYNNDSLTELLNISCIEDRNLTYLATGDLEKPGVQKLLSQNPDVHADVLAVPHHGSKGAGTALLEATHPQLALISAGKNNEYGHPHQEITQYLAQHHVPTASTIESGHIATYVEQGRLMMVSSHARGRS